MDVVDALAKKTRPSGSGFKLGKITAIDDDVDPYLYSVDGSKMTMQQPGLVVGDLVLYWFDPHSPVGFGKPVGD